MRYFLGFFTTLAVTAATQIWISIFAQGVQQYIWPGNSGYPYTGITLPDPFTYDLDDTGTISYVDGLSTRRYFNYGPYLIIFKEIPFIVPVEDDVLAPTEDGKISYACSGLDVKMMMPGAQGACAPRKMRIEFVPTSSQTSSLTSLTSLTSASTDTDAPSGLCRVVMV